jgi:hypothetical protein
VIDTEDDGPLLDMSLEEGRGIEEIEGNSQTGDFRMTIGPGVILPAVPELVVDPRYGE